MKTSALTTSILTAVARLLGWMTGRHPYFLLAEALMAVDSPEARVWGDE